MTDTGAAAAESTGRLFVITGANSGLGLETARNLAAASPFNTVILACRDLTRADEARREISQSTGNSLIRGMQLDLSSMQSVREFAANLAETLEQPIDALICNAGISTGPALTVDGIDGVFETNHLGHFLLTLLLVDRMSPNGRVISVSSDMHQPPGPALKWPGAAALAHPRSRPGLRRLRYSYSKLCNLYFVYELSRRLRAHTLSSEIAASASPTSTISVAAFNPGLMTDTNFASMSRPVGAVLRRIFASRVGSLAASSAALAHLATEQPADAIDGLYFDRNAGPARRSSEISYNAANAVDLWRVSASLTGVGD